MPDSIRSLTTLSEILLIERPTFGDERGFFHEFFRLNELEVTLGRPFIPIQGNHSRSGQGVLRGIHVADFDKLIYVPFGQVLAVLVDLRPDSPTFKRWEAVELGGDTHPALFVPLGFGNSYYVRSPQADYLYIVSAYYGQGKEATIRWNDPDLAINWPIAQPLISERDQQALSFQEWLTQMRTESG